MKIWNAFKALMKFLFWTGVVISVGACVAAYIYQEPIVLAVIPIYWIGGFVSILGIVAFIAAIIFVFGAAVWFTVKLLFILSVMLIALFVVMLIMLPFAGAL
jgi:hypothetical protein